MPEDETPAGATAQQAPQIETAAGALSTARRVLDERLPGAVLGLDGVPPEGALLIAAGQLVAAARVLKEDERLRFTLPLFVTAVDHPDREPRFDLVYQLRSLDLKDTIRLKVGVADSFDGLPRVPSLCAVWRGMNWLEREVYDLFGIDFEGSPDQRRLLMPDDWEGHPLRKDYISFGEPVRFTDRGSFPPDAAVPHGAPD
ncbi:MAG TPA: NADH-quinone oxidoreductase subunit C [Candidatus Dormibacteraeota bacterium]|jgi:NADH-quinone oxidoreductase subunit C|nr:NADH-quinone oxidoreductase subunit C [Candidatus Dormibacteraeota bacterium]